MLHDGPLVIENGARLYTFWIRKKNDDDDVEQ